MNLVRYQEWLNDRQWNGYPLKSMLVDAVSIAGTAPETAYRALRSLTILTNGLSGEQGEAVEHFKKWVRDGQLDKKEAGIELGDVLAYLTWLAKTLGYSLEDLAEMNYDKLTERARLGTGAPAV